MRIFGSDRLDSMLGRLGMKEGEAIIHPWVNKALEKAQGKVEARNFDIRKNLLKFDDVMNDQRKAIFAQRREIMEAQDLVRRHRRHAPPGGRGPRRRARPGQGLRRPVGHRRPRRPGAATIFGLELPVADWADEEGVDDADIRERLLAATDEQMAAKAARYGAETMRADREAGAAADHRQPTGASTSSPSTTCAASSASAATPSATR